MEYVERQLVIQAIEIATDLKISFRKKLRLTDLNKIIRALPRKYNLKMKEIRQILRKHLVHVRP